MSRIENRPDNRIFRQRPFRMFSATERHGTAGEKEKEENKWNRSDGGREKATEVDAHRQGEKGSMGVVSEGRKGEGGGKKRENKTLDKDGSGVITVPVITHL